MKKIFSRKSTAKPTFGMNGPMSTPQRYPSVELVQWRISKQEFAKLRRTNEKIIPNERVKAESIAE